MGVSDPLSGDNLPPSLSARRILVAASASCLAAHEYCHLMSNKSQRSLCLACTQVGKAALTLIVLAMLRGAGFQFHLSYWVVPVSIIITGRVWPGRCRRLRFETCKQTADSCFESWTLFRLKQCPNTPLYIYHDFNYVYHVSTRIRTRAETISCPMPPRRLLAASINRIGPA